MPGYPRTDGLDGCTRAAVVLWAAVVLDFGGCLDLETLLNSNILPKFSMGVQAVCPDLFGPTLTPQFS